MLPDALPQLTSPDWDGDDFSLSVNVEEDKADVPPAGKRAQPDLTRERRLPVPGDLKQWSDWARKGLLMLTLFLGSMFAGFHYFGEKSTVPPVAHQASRQANAGAPATRLELQPRPQIVPIYYAQDFVDVLKAMGQNVQPAPVVVPPAGSLDQEARQRIMETLQRLMESQQQKMQAQPR